MSGTSNTKATSTAVRETAANGNHFITLIFGGGLTPSQQDIFHGAAKRWETVITGQDLGRVSFTVDGQRISTTGVVIKASGTAIDGRGGVLGQAGPTMTRSSNGLPCMGDMEFDIDDMAFMEREGLLSNVILHEMGHVLGVGTLWDRFIINYRTDPQYIGQNALAQYNIIRQARGLAPATSVPVENAGRPRDGSYGGHWRESVFDTELMTSIAERPGVGNPMSKITVGALEDLGYQVDYTRTDNLDEDLVLPARVMSAIRFNYDILRPLCRKIDDDGSGKAKREALAKRRGVEMPQVRSNLVPICK